MALTTVALFYAPFKKATGNFKIMLAVIGLACLVRVTTVMFWLGPGIATMRLVGWRDRLIWTPLIIIMTILLGLLVDSYFYRKLTLSWWNFYEWNVLKGVSNFYGREPAAYHLKVTLPLMLNTQVFYFGLGIWRGAWRRELIGLTMAVFLWLSSMQTHKETRFLAPIYPLILICTSFGAQQVNLLLAKKQRVLRLLAKLILASVICSNILIAWFYSRVHYSGAYEILDKINDSARETGGSVSVFILTPCHVLPFKGYMHRIDIEMDFLKCHPAAVDEMMPVEESEARDQFNRDPKRFIKEKVIESSRGYSHLILYETDLEKYRDLFIGKYEECARVAESKIIKRRGDLIIFCKK
jgi:GPI mannosyltransferase 3